MSITPCVQGTRTQRPRKGADSRLPGDDTVNPHLGQSYPPAAVHSFQLSRTHKAHAGAIADIA